MTDMSGRLALCALSEYSVCFSYTLLRSVLKTEECAMRSPCLFRFRAAMTLLLACVYASVFGQAGRGHGPGDAMVGQLFEKLLDPERRFVKHQSAGNRSEFGEALPSLSGFVG